MANPVGRPSILTDQMIAKVVDAVGRVLVTRHVAGLCGIDHTTIYDWFNKAKEDKANGITDSMHVKFSNAYKAAQGAKVDEFVDAIAQRTPGWQANAWLLERCFREDFGADAGIIQDLAEKQNKLEALLTEKVEGKSNAGT